MHMDLSKSKKIKHLFLRVLAEIFTARAGFHLQQHQNFKE